MFSMFCALFHSISFYFLFLIFYLIFYFIFHVFFFNSCVFIWLAKRPKSIRNFFSFFSFQFQICRYKQERKNSRKSVLKTVNGTRRLKVRVSGDEIVKRAVVLKGQMIYDWAHRKSYSFLWTDLKKEKERKEKFPSMC